MYLSITMSNPVNQRPSYKSNTITQADPMGHTPVEIKHNHVVVMKENSGYGGYKQFTSNCTVSTEALKPGFSATRCFVQKSKEGKEADADNTNYTYIQELLCSNLTKMDSLEHHVVSYTLNDILMIREFCKTLNVHPQFCDSINFQLCPVVATIHIVQQARSLRAIPDLLLGI